MLNILSNAISTIPLSLSLLLTAIPGSAGAQGKVISETLLQSDKSWDGTPYTHYSTGQPQL
jgi:hypothetical protein